MRIENALPQMREGKKMRHPSFEKDVWFQACRIGFNFNGMPIDEWPISIVKMQGDKEHPDMRPSIRDGFKPECRHGNFPLINLLLLMSEEWEIFE